MYSKDRFSTGSGNGCTQVFLYLSLAKIYILFVRLVSVYFLFIFFFPSNNCLMQAADISTLSCLSVRGQDSQTLDD